jgi:hypothetical protein
MSCSTADTSGLSLPFKPSIEFQDLILKINWIFWHRLSNAKLHFYVAYGLSSVLLTTIWRKVNLERGADAQLVHFVTFNQRLSVDFPKPLLFVLLHSFSSPF